jgi:hypothetical protein
VRRLISTGRILLLVCVCMALTTMVAWSYSSVFQASNGAQLNVTATATWIGNTLDAHYGMYKYQYVVSFGTGWTRPLSNFGVNDTGHYEWVDAYCNKPSNFSVMPVYRPDDPTQTSFTWNASTVLQNNAGPVEFGYYSYWRSDVVGASANGGGWNASGTTLGMVPEPGTLAALGLGMTGMAGYLMRGARRRRK